MKRKQVATQATNFLELKLGMGKICRRVYWGRPQLRSARKAQAQGEVEI